MDINTPVNRDDRAPNDDSPCLVLVIVVRTPLVGVAATAVLLGLAGRQTAVSPTVSGAKSVQPRGNRSVVFSCSAQHRFLRKPRCHSSIYARGTLLSAWQRLRPSTADSCCHLSAYLLSRPTTFCSNLSQSIG